MFKPLDEDFYDASITLPIRGKEYTIPSPDAETGLFCQRLMTGAFKVLSGREVSDAEASKIKLGDDEELDLYERLLGPAWSEMLADKVPWAWIQHAGTTTLIWVAQGRAQAEEFWGSETAPKPREPQDHLTKGSSPRKKSKAVTAGETSSTTGPSSKPTSPTAA